MNEENLKNESTDAPENAEAVEAAETNENTAAENESTTFASKPAEGGIYVGDEAEAGEDTEESAKSKLPNKAIIAIAAGIVIIAVVVVLVVTGKVGNGKYNKYNRMYVDIYGEYAEDFAEQQGMEYDEFLEYYSLPADMPKDTNINAVQNLIPVGRYLELFGGGYTLDVMKEQMGWDDSITEDTLLGDALGKTALRYYVGEEQFDAYKEHYGLGDEVTLDTTFGEIRDTVDKKTKADYEEQKAMSESLQNAETNSAADEAPVEAAPENGEAAADSAE